jgi:hypothetical protein
MLQYLVAGLNNQSLISGVSIDGTLPAGAMTCTADQAASPSLWQIVSGALVAYAAPVTTIPPTLAQQAQSAMAAGVTITSASNPLLNGTYACDATAQQHLMAEMIALQVSGNTLFADGTNSVIWPNITGSLHTYTPAQFQPLALAIGAYVAALYKCVSGVLTVLPAPSVTIP